MEVSGFHFVEAKYCYFLAFVFCKNFQLCTRVQECNNSCEESLIVRSDNLNFSLDSSIRIKCRCVFYFISRSPTNAQSLSYLAFDSLKKSLKRKNSMRYITELFTEKKKLFVQKQSKNSDHLREFVEK